MAKYNVIGDKHVSRKIDRAARVLIEGFRDYTPASEAEIDRIMGIGTRDGAGEPDPEALAETPDAYAWMETEKGPSPAALRSMQKSVA